MRNIGDCYHSNLLFLIRIMNVKKVFLIIALLTSISALRAIEYNQNVSAIISLKTPGNYAKSYLLTLKELNANGFNYLLESDNPLPVTLFQNVTTVH